MSAVESSSSLFEEEGRDPASDAAFLDSLPRRLRIVTAREELTREALPRRGDSLNDPQLSEATQRVWDAEKSTARALAEQYRALAALYEHDGQYEEVTELDEVDTARAALALRVTSNGAAWQLRDAYQAVHLFPNTLVLLESGTMPSAWFLRMLKSSRALSDASRRQLDITVSTWSTDITAERFFLLLKRLIRILEQREDQPVPVAALERSVELLPGQEPGMGVLQIVGPIPDILGQWKTLDESARAVQAAQRAALRDGAPIPHDPDGIVLETGRALSLTRLRFALLVTASLDLEGVVVPAERFRLNLTIPVLTMLGASDEPGTLEGVHPLPPSMARSLAGSTDAWYRVLTDPCSGAFLPLPADRFVPTSAMLEHLRLRHQMCAVPGCTRSTSWASECDHIEECQRGNPEAGGLTEIENLHLLCWQHHLDKTNGLLDPTRLPARPTEPGRTRWAVGTQGDVVTVIDDLDTASIAMATTLEAAWVAFLRGTHAGSVATEPGPTAQDPPPPPPSRPPGTAPPVLPQPAPHVTGSPTSGSSITGPPAPGSSRAPRPPSSGGTEIPPGPWDDQGPPPF